MMPCQVTDSTSIKFFGDGAQPDVLDQVPEDEEIDTVTADGAYDTCRYHAAIIAGEAFRSFRSGK